MQTALVGAESVELDGLRGRIEEWRQKRPRVRPMPPELWSEAVVAAQRLGVWPVSRALKINYGALKGRMVSSRGRRGSARAGKTRDALIERPHFIELQGLSGVREAQVAAADGAREESVVEVVAADGARLTIRLKGVKPDVAGLLNAFRGRA